MVLLLLSSGIGFRQTHRIVALTRRNTTMKFRKLARHLTHFNLSLADAPQTDEVSLQFDELETYETRRSTRPLTLPVLIEKNSRFFIGAASAPIRPSGKFSDARKRAIAEDEARFGPRKDGSKPVLKAVLKLGRKFSRNARTVILATDCKTTYPKFAKAAFKGKRLVHHQTLSTLPRTTFNPLFPINHVEATLRDLMGRLRRESWLASKKGRYLDLHLQAYMAYRNFSRARFNRDTKTPAEILGFTDRALSLGQLLSWRQDWGAERSPHPLSNNGDRTVPEYQTRRAA